MSQGTPTIPQKVSDLKQKILNPSLTSHYLVEITPPNISGKMSELGASYSATNNNDLISIPCSEASLPGTSLATINIDNDYRGISEKHAYRRIYDDNINFTFYVDVTSGKEYYVIKFFEAWMAFIGNQDNATIQNPTYDYRVKFPSTYYANSMIIQKFEKNFGSSSGETQTTPLKYEFFQAYPLNISSIPLSYDSSQLLKYSVSFSYSRYKISNSSYRSNTTQTNPNAPAVPEFTTYSEGVIDDILTQPIDPRFEFEYNPPVNRPVTDFNGLA